MNSEKASPFDYLEYSILRTILTLLGIIPFSVRARIGEWIGLGFFYAIPRIRNRVIENIGYAFPDKGVEWRRLLAKKNLRMFGRQIAEFIQTSYIDEKFFRKWFVPLPDSESHQRIYERGGICILGHLGNWEWHGFLAGHLAGHDIYTLVKRQRNPLTNRYVERMRNRAHMRFIYIDQNAFITIGKLRKGGLVAFTSDQNARGNGGFFPFFGRLASTYLGPASVARNTKVPVYFVWSYRDKMGRLNFGFEEIERPDEIPVEDSERWEKAFTYRWVRLLEKHVLEHPEDYLWAHNRWKTQPENPEEIWREFQ